MRGTPLFVAADWVSTGVADFTGTVPIFATVVDAGAGQRALKYAIWFVSSTSAFPTEARASVIIAHPVFVSCC